MATAVREKKSDKRVDKRAPKPVEATVADLEGGVGPLIYTDSEVEALKRAAARRLAQLARQGITVDFKPEKGPVRKVPLKGMIVPGFADDESLRNLNKSERRALLTPIVQRTCVELLADDDLDRTTLALLNRMRAQDEAGRRSAITAWSEEILDDMIGFGPLEELVTDYERDNEDEMAEDIYVIGWNKVLVKTRAEDRVREVKSKRPRLGSSDETIHFRSQEHLRNIVYRNLSEINRRVDENSPILDSKMPGTDHRINITIPPVAADGIWYITIRKHVGTWNWKDLLLRGVYNTRLLALLALCVRARFNILVTGGTGAGKTTLMSVIAGFIPPHERVVTIEDTQELQLTEDQKGTGVGEMDVKELARVANLDMEEKNVVSLLTKTASTREGTSFTMRDLVINSLRLSPRRIIVGEVRGAEAWDMLQALNTGHDGSICTIHSSGASYAISRLQALVRMSNAGITDEGEITGHIFDAFQLVIHAERQGDGGRRVNELGWIRSIDNLAETDKDFNIEVVPLFRLKMSNDEKNIESFEQPIDPKTGQPYLVEFFKDPRALERLRVENFHPQPGVESDLDILSRYILSDVDDKVSDADFKRVISYLTNDTLSELDRRVRRSADPEAIQVIQTENIEKIGETIQELKVRWAGIRETDEATPDEDRRARRRALLAPDTRRLLERYHNITQRMRMDIRVNLIWKDNPGTVFRVRVDRETVIGRAIPEIAYYPDIDLSELAIDGQPALVSRVHAEISLGELGFYIVDRRSRNGTYVNDMRLAPDIPRKLKGGDRVRFGRLEFTFFLDY